MKEKKQKDIVVKEEINLPVLAEEEIQKFETTLTEIEIPRIHLVLGSTGFKLFDEVFDNFYGVILEFQRANFYRVDDELVCFSQNGVEPSVSNPLSSSCVFCPKNKFMEGKKECRNILRLIILSNKAKFPLILSLPPTSQKNFKSFLGEIFYKGLFFDELICEFSTEIVKRKSFNIPVVKFRIVGEITDEMKHIINLHKKLAQSIKKVISGKILEEEEEIEIDKEGETSENV